MIAFKANLPKERINTTSNDHIPEYGNTSTAQHMASECWKHDIANSSGITPIKLRDYTTMRRKQQSDSLTPVTRQ